MAIDRSKFKASSQSAIEQKDKAAETAAGKGRKQGITETFAIENGNNRFRVYPAHPDGGGEAYAEEVSRVFLPAMVAERDEQNRPIKIGDKVKQKKGMKPVFNSRIHGGTPKDLVEEYLKLGLAKAEGIEDAEAKKQFLAKLNGQYHDKPEFRKPGIQYKLTYEMYADKLGTGNNILEFGRLAVSNSVKGKMNTVAGYESANDPLGLDPYSDPTDGLPLIITKKVTNADGSKVKPADMYVVTIDKTFDRQTDKLIRHPLSDEQLEKFLEFPSLFKTFRGSFKRTDFELQLAGLEMFDADYSIGVFHTDEFLAVAEEIDAYYPEVNETEGAQTGTEDPEVEGEDPEVQETPAKDQFAILTRLELKNYIVKEKLGITFKTTTTDDQLRDLIRKALEATKGLNSGHLPTDPKPTTAATPAPATTAAGQSATAARLAKIRGNQG